MEWRAFPPVVHLSRILITISGLHKGCHADHLLSNYLPSSRLISSAILETLMILFCIFSALNFPVFFDKRFMLFIPCRLQVLFVIHGYPGSEYQRSHLCFVTLACLCFVLVCLGGFFGKHFCQRPFISVCGIYSNPAHNNIVIFMALSQQPQLSQSTFRTCNIKYQ